MKVHLLVLAVVFLALHFHCKNPPSSEKLFVARDFTAENLFSENIEGPDFDQAGNLYVVNFQRDGTIGKVHAEGSCELFLELPTGSNANSIKFNSKGDMLLADWPMHNILKVDMKTKQVSVFCHEERFNQPNDLCINKKDQLFASDPNWKDGSGQLWRIEPDGRTMLLESGMGTTNGIELSPDEKRLYVAESTQRRIWHYDIDATGNISNKRLLIEFPDFGLDGMKCDRAGNLYITRHGKGAIAIVSPDGRLIREVPLKGKKCSNLVFGGKDGRTVFVTLQDRKGMEMFRADVPGKKWITQGNPVDTIDPIAEQIDILALGDSYTTGESVAWAKNFPNQLNDALKAEGYTVGSTCFIAQSGWQSDQLISAVQSQSSVIGDSTFSLVTLCIGANNQFRNADFKTYKKEFENLLQTAIARTGSRKGRVFVISLPDWAYTADGQNFGNQAATSLDIDRYNTAIQAIAESYGVRYVHITNISRQCLERPELVASDGLHPSAIQYAEWVTLMMPMVREALKE